MSEPAPTCAMLRNADGTVDVVPIKPGRDPARDGFYESLDWSRREERVPLRLSVPMPVELLADEVLDAAGKPITC